MFEMIKELFGNEYKAKYEEAIKKMEENEKRFDMLYGLARGTNEELRERVRKLESEIEENKEKRILDFLEDGEGCIRVGNRIEKATLTRVEYDESGKRLIKCHGYYFQ